MNLIAIGKIVAVHGLKGHLVVRHSLGQRSDFEGVKAIFLGSHQAQSLPYFIIETTSKSLMDTQLLLEEIDNREKASKLINKPVALKEEDFNRLVNKKSPLGLVGFSMVANNELLGVIAAINEQTMQVIATVTVGDKEVLVPLHEETIDSIDRKNKKVHVVLPAGLLEIYL